MIWGCCVCCPANPGRACRFGSSRDNRSDVQPGYSTEQFRGKFGCCALPGGPHASAGLPTPRAATPPDPHAPSLPPARSRSPTRVGTGNGQPPRGCVAGPAAQRVGGRAMVEGGSARSCARRPPPPPPYGKMLVHSRRGTLAAARTRRPGHLAGFWNGMHAYGGKSRESSHPC